MEPERNLDYLASKYALVLVGKFGRDEKKRSAGERTATKALGILQEQGVYACALFLNSRRDKEGEFAKEVADTLWDLLPKLVERPAGAKQLDFYANTLNARMDDLFLVRDVFEQTLIYARYGAKAPAAE
jgi:hypothetical protein